MTELSEQEMLDELTKFDTPSITNVVATYPDHPLCLGLYDPWADNWLTPDPHPAKLFLCRDTRESPAPRTSIRQ